MINVHFTEEAKNHLVKKNVDTITVDMMQLSPCTGKYDVPTVWIGKSAGSLAKYDLLNSHGFNVYVYKGAEAEPEGIEISLVVEDGFRGPIESLNVSGLIYEKTDLG